MADIHIYPEKSGSAGGGPEDDSQYAARSIRVNGLSVFAFGLTLAFTFLILFIVVGILKDIFIVREDVFIAFVNSVRPFDWFSYVLYGLFTGICIAGIYNLLVVKRINLWGIESSVD